MKNQSICFLSILVLTAVNDAAASPPHKDHFVCCDAKRGERKRVEENIFSHLILVDTRWLRTALKRNHFSIVIICALANHRKKPACGSITQ